MALLKERTTPSRIWMIGSDRALSIWVNEPKRVCVFSSGLGRFSNKALEMR